MALDRLKVLESLLDNIEEGVCTGLVACFEIIEPDGKKGLQVLTSDAAGHPMTGWNAIGQFRAGQIYVERQL